MNDTTTGAFDFQRHEQNAVSEYLKVRHFYSDLASAKKRILEEAIKKREIQVHSIEARAKDPSSLGRKASKPSDVDFSQPKYPRPLEQITDLSAIRIITFFPRTISDIDRLLTQEFEVLERSDKREDLLEEEKFGYQSVHYLVRFNNSRAVLSEYERFAGAISEIQVRTILQHAWAEIEHDIQYKSASTIPSDIRRRFMSLAGLLEIADREFQAIQDADRDLTTKANSLVVEGKLDDVEITPSAVKSYLDKKIGADGRVSDFSYDWTARLLKKLGFRTLQQVDNCIQRYNGDQLSRILTGTRQGPTTRFEFMLLAGMGERFAQRHLYAAHEWFGEWPRKNLKKLTDNL